MLLVFSLQKYKYNVSWIEFLWIYHFWVCSASWICRFKPFVKLESFQSLFLQAPFQPHSSLFGDSNDMNVGYFAICPCSWGTFLGGGFYFSLLFRLCKFHCSLSLSWVIFIIPLSPFITIHQVFTPSYCISQFCFIWLLLVVAFYKFYYLLRLSIFHLF